jgi:hypothetical protein
MVRSMSPRDSALAGVCWLLAASACDSASAPSPGPATEAASDAGGAVEDASDPEPAPASSAGREPGPADSFDAGAVPADRLETDSAFAGGTRLRAVLAEASDGSTLFLHWWDTELAATCKFEPVDESDGGFRCLPAEVPMIYLGIDELFADAQCSRPLWRGDAPGPDGSRVVQRFDTRCSVARDYFRVGARFSQGTVYRKSDAGCTPEPAGAQHALHSLEPLPLQAFVAAELAAGAASGKVAPQQLVAQDGARAPQGFRDLAGDFDCWPRETTEGLRCVPASFGWGDRGVYADMRCSMPAAIAESCGNRRSALPYVLFTGVTEAVTKVHRGGARLSAVFEQVGAEGCSTGASESVAFAIGEPVALESLLPAVLSRVTQPSGLVQTMATVSSSRAEMDRGVSVARHDRLAASALGGYECTLARTPDGSIRCVPPTGFARTEYADPACTEPVWQAYWDHVSVSASFVAIDVPEAGRVGLPEIERVLTGATPYDGPVYARNGGPCTLVAGVPNARQPYRRFASEAPLHDLPALTIVVR